MEEPFETIAFATNGDAQRAEVIYLEMMQEILQLKQQVKHLEEDRLG